MTILAISAVVVLALVVGLAIWLVPRWQVDHWRRAGVTDEEKLAELSMQARSSITQAFGGLALVATLAITAYQVTETRRSSEDTLRLAEHGQLAERFSQAVEQLGATDADGDPAIDVRTGALFALRSIGLDSKDFAEPAFFTVVNYVTNNYVPPDELHHCSDFAAPSTDVATALRFVLPDVSGALPANPGEDDDERDPVAPDLRGASLQGLSIDELRFEGFDLFGIDLDSAFLNEADFRKSNLVKAEFDGACLRKAKFGDANLQKATLVGADLRNAVLVGADLSDAHLRRADLRGAELDGAILTNADMHGAKLFAKDLADADLSSEQRDEIVVF